MRTFTLILFLVSGVTVHSQNRLKDQLRDDVTYLSEDSLEGREMGTRGEIIASRYIANRFEAIGLTPLDSCTYFIQEFKKKVYVNPHDTTNYTTILGRNVAGTLNSQGVGTIIIGAHYDHLGYGGDGSGSLSTEIAIHNGADDNASGVAGLLYLAEKLSKKRLKHKIIFIAFTGEEKGLLGSNYFSNNFLSQEGDISFMINMDMIGRLDTARTLAIYGVGTSTTFVPALEKTMGSEFTLVMDSSGFGPSDHTSFYLKDIPVLHFFTGQHEQYHTPEDDAALINYEGLFDVVFYIRKLIRILDEQDDLPFSKTNDNRGHDRKRAFNVTLGIIPDYLFDGKGLRIDGVKSGKSADAAEILKGDILLVLGAFKINSIYDYMEALEFYHAGDTVDCIILRSGEEIKLEVKFL